MFSYKNHRELAEPGTRNKEWVLRLTEVVKALNNETTRFTGEKPSLVSRKKSVKAKPAALVLRPIGFKERRLSSDVMVRYLYALGELEVGEQRRATDPLWSVTSLQVEWAVFEGGKPVLYYFSDGPKRAIVREELQVVPFGTKTQPA